MVSPQARVARDTPLRQQRLPSLAGWFAVAYVHLWVGEGALRKWVPGLGELMYVARDAATVAVLTVLILSHTRSRRPASMFWAASVVIGVAGAAAVVVADLPPQVAVAGVRSYLAPFLLPVVVMCFAPQWTLPRMGRAMLAWLPVQLVLGAIQGTLPPSSPINRELSGEESRFVQGGVVRITGTFTAPSGLTSYLILAFAVLLAALVGGMFVRRRLAVVLLLMGITAVSISGSRGAVLGVSIVLAYAIVHSAFTRPGITVRLAATVASVGVAAWLSATALFPQIVTAFLNRFEAADRAEDTGARILGQTIGFFNPENFSIFGSGVGGTSIVGIALGSGQSWVEVESTRWVVELGLLGLALATGRLILGVGLTAAILVSPSRFNTGSVLLAGVVAPTLLFGTIGQNPSYQGAFAIALSLLILTLGTSTQQASTHYAPATNQQRQKEHQHAPRFH